VVNDIAVDARARAWKCVTRSTIVRPFAGRALDAQRRTPVAFVQIIDFRTSKYDEMHKVGEEWEAAVGSRSKARRRVMCEDRDNPGRYLNIVFFDSYESAMENSDDAATQEFSQRMMALSDGPPTFYNLNVLEDVS
jgi:hypothetical protein